MAPTEKKSIDKEGCSIVINYTTVVRSKINDLHSADASLIRYAKNHTLRSSNLGLDEMVTNSERKALIANK